MKTSVRFLSLLLAVFMIAGAAITASAEKTEKIANDEALSFLVKLGIFGGYEDGSLKPDNKVERDEMAKIIFTLSTTFTDAGTGTVSFADVPADDWSAGYISWCSTKGIVGGYGDGNFGPNDFVTYDQALKMVCGAMGYNEWDSNLWPTDVRTVALTNLSLGENLESVKGSDFVTRVQIAQIVYNALDKDMNETKPGPYGTKLPMTLKTDVWGVSEVADKIVATENFYLAGGTATAKEDEISLNVYGDATLEELGLDEYVGKTDDIIGAEVNVIYRGEDILGTTIKSIYSDEVELAEDKENKLYVNGVEVNSENPVNVIEISDNGLVSYTAFTTLPNKDYAYDVKAVDFNADGKVDALEVNYYLAATVKSVGNKSVIFDNLPDGIDADKVVENELLVSSAALAENDVVVLKVSGPIVEVVEVVSPITATVTKFGNSKITFDGKEYAVNKDVFVNLLPTALDSTVMDEDGKGNAREFDFYVYNGKVFYVTDNNPEIGDYNFAVLAYVNTPEKPVLNTETQEFTQVYTAVLVIDGRETLVSLNPDETIIDENGQIISIAQNKEEVLAAYGKSENIKDGYLQAPYTLVSYVVDDDGKYTLSLKDTSNTDYKILEPGTKITYNKKLGLYNIQQGLYSDLVVMNDASAIYYTYTKKATGAHKYLGIYTKADIKNEFEEAETVGYSFLYKGENDKFYTLVAAMIKEELVEIINKADYKTDARQFFYCYQSSNQVMAEDLRNVNYSYFMRSVYNGTNLDEEINTKLTAAQGATEAKKGFIYAWDEETKNYIEVTKSNLESLGITSLGIYNLDDIINGCLFTEGGKYFDGIKVSDDASIWSLGASATSFKTNTLEDIVNYIAIKDEYNELNSKSDPLKVIIGTHLDENKKEVASVIIVQQFKYDSEGDPAYNSTTLIDNFNT